MINEKKMCVYVSSPKNYSDILDIFLLCKKKFWSDCPYDTVISTNYDLNISEVHVINSENSKDTWVERSWQALRQIDYKYVLLLCDDLFISEHIDNKRIKEIIDYMDLKGIKFCRLKPLHRGKTVDELPYLDYVNKNTPYGINLQRGIFLREYLIELLGNGEQSAWDIEGKLLEQAACAKDEPFEDIISCNRNIFPVIHGVEKGKWFPSAIKKLSKIGIRITNNREIMSRQIEIRQNVISYLGSHISPKTRIRIKIIAQKMGYKFINSN